MLRPVIIFSSIFPKKARFYRQKVVPMEANARRYNCGLCYRQVIICRDCDRGNLYCGAGCARLARQKSLRAAGKRYQKTRRGKHHHAKRQQRYRQRQYQKVTHHSSHKQTDLSSSPGNPRGSKQVSHKDYLKLTCNFCRCACSVLLRKDFLSLHMSTQKKRMPRMPLGP